jgi:hypothetical protein
LGFLFGLDMFVMALWWRRLLFTRSQAGGTAEGYSIIVAMSGLLIATAFVIRRPYLLSFILLATALPSLYLLGGEGPTKWAGYGYLGALLAAWLMRSRRETYR